MTINIKELRRLAQAATPGPWIGCGPSFGESLPKYLNEVVVDREGDEDDGYSICNTPIGLDEEQLSADMAFIAAANPAAVSEIIDRLEEAETDALEQARLNGMGASREAALMAKLEAAEKERDTLLARIEAMENQEPYAFAVTFPETARVELVNDLDALYEDMITESYEVRNLYLAPGAQPAPSVPVDLITDYLVSISAHVAHQDDPKAQAEIRELLRMFAATPEKR